MTVVLRPLVDADLPAVLALNNAAVPAVPPMQPDTMTAVVAAASLALTAVDDATPDEPLGFLLAMDAGVDYDSENYRWFTGRSVGFVYIDRIVIAEAARGRGLGRLLYDAVFDRASRQGHEEVTCEVNLRPANPESLAFHERLGFVRVGEQETKGGAYRVALLAAPVPPPAASA